MDNECAVWSSEQVDDSLKELFMAVERYKFHSTKSTGHNKGMAVSMIRKQLDERLPVIEQKARDSCHPAKPCVDTSGLKSGMKEVMKMMEAGASYGEVFKKALEVDTKYALPAYKAFCACPK